jgi:uncharacterized OB-fold protein
MTDIANTSDERRFLLPELDDDSTPFWAWCRRGELRVQRCDHCGRLRFPPRPMCPRCRSFLHEWIQLDGRGSIWSFAVPHPPLLGSYTEQAPYNVIVVAMAEDPTIRMVGNLVETVDGPLDEIDPHTVEIGAPVEVVFRPTAAPEIMLPAWRRSARES